MSIIGLGGVNKRIDDENFDSLEDAIANREFGMDYKQLGKNEKEWVRDEMDIIGLGGIGAVKKGQFKKINYSFYNNKSADYILSEIAHTERSARQFQMLNDYASMENRVKHAKKLWSIYYTLKK
jgi:hypothetical protein